MGQTIYELTRQVLAEEIDMAEGNRGTTVTFDPGTRFTIIHGPHAWGITQTAHCTVQINGKHYNILWPVLRASMREVDPLG